MTVTFYVTVTCYLCMHLYIFWHLRAAFPVRLIWLLFPWFIAMGTFNFIYLLTPPESEFRILLSTAAGTWTPFAFFLCFYFLLADAGRMLPALLKERLPEVSFPRRLIVTPFLIALALCTYAYALHESRTLQITRLTFTTDKFAEDEEPVRLVYVSDLHIGPSMTAEHVQPLVTTIASFNPDCILFGGDIVDDNTLSTPEHIREFNKLKAPLGKFAVHGNHEAFGKPAVSNQFYTDIGFRILAAEKTTVGPFSLVGIDDPAMSQKKKQLTNDPLPALKQIPDDQFVILLDHRPDMRPEIVGLVDLQLSGHTHGAQLFFLRPLLMLFYDVLDGRKEYGTKDATTTLYVSRGIGFSSRVPVRLFVPPELVIIDIIPASGSNP